MDSSRWRIAWQTWGARSVWRGQVWRAPGIVRTRMRRRISSTVVDTLGAQPTRWTCTSGDLEDRQAQDCFDFRH